MKRSVRVVAAALCCAMLCVLSALPAAAEEEIAFAEMDRLAEPDAIASGYEPGEAPRMEEGAFPEEAVLQAAARACKTAGGNFMEGMVMLPGARGENVELLILALYRWEGGTEGVAKRLTDYVAAQRALWYHKANLLLTDDKILLDAAKKYGYSDVPEEGFLFCAAVRELKRFLDGTDAPLESFTQGVGAAVWRALGLEVRESFEAAFGKPGGGWMGGGLSPIKMKLEGDTLTLDYSPTFYVTRDYPEYSLSDEEIEEIIDECVDGFKMWEGDYAVYGRTLTLAVDVHPSVTKYKLRADVKIVPEDGLASMVFGALFWRPNSPFLQMRIKTDDPRYEWFDDTCMHEFGHVTGLFDAYGYASHVRGMTFLGIELEPLIDKWLPEAPLERAPYGCIMRSGWRVIPTEAEMLLWAWKHKRLQLFTESILTWLGAEVSYAFWY